MFPYDAFDRITFEHGFRISKDDNGEWVCVTPEKGIEIPSGIDIPAELNLRPIVAEGPCGDSRMALVLPSLKGRLLSIYLSELALPRPLHFVMGSMLYHCMSLARLYGDKTAEHIDWCVEDAKSGKTSPWSNQSRVVTVIEEIYYEFEALVTSVVRGYEYLRYPIWKKYQSGISTPRSFESTVNKCVSLGLDIKRIQHSKNTYFDAAKEYRDCIQHNVDIGSSSWCMYELKNQKTWTLTAKIPDNPEVKSAKQFTFHKNLDALTTGWEYVTEFFAAVDFVLGEGNLS